MAEGQPGLERRGKPRQGPLVASRVSTATGLVAGDVGGASGGAGHLCDARGWA